MTAAAHVGATTHAQPPGLTFTYTPADIQGLAEPAARGGGGIQVAASQHHHHLQHSHALQVQSLQATQRAGLVGGAPVNVGLSMSGPRPGELVDKQIRAMNKMRVVWSSYESG